MATIIDNTYFTKELTLPVDNINIQTYIDEHEPIILRKALGYPLATEFKDALDAGSPVQKWVDLRDGKEYESYSGYNDKYEGIFSIIADYVYIQISKSIQTYATDGGVKSANTENSIDYSPRYRQKFANDDMINRISKLDEFIRVTNDDTADTYEDYLPESFEKMTVFNI